MDHKSKQIGFVLKRVSTEQFAIIEDAFTKDGKIRVGTNIRFGSDEKTRMIAVFSSFTFECNKKPFLLIETGCHFEISDESWAQMLSLESNTLTVPAGFIRHLAMLTVGTTRGVLHAKTEDTPFNQFVLPTINVSEIIQQDSIFKF